MTTISPSPQLQFLDANGNPLSYGLLYTYFNGTTVPKTTYTTALQTTANTNPIVLDARGEANVWLLAGEIYKFVLQNSSGVLQYTVDNITAAGTMSTQQYHWERNRKCRWHSDRQRRWRRHHWRVVQRRPACGGAQQNYQRCNNCQSAAALRLFWNNY